MRKQLPGLNFWSLQINFSPLLFWRCTHERYRKRSRELDWIRVPRERFNSSDNFIIGHICPDKILFMFWKALSFSTPPILYIYYLKGFLDRRGHPKYWVIYSGIPPIPLFFFPFFTFIKKVPMDAVTIVYVIKNLIGVIHKPIFGNQYWLNYSAERKRKMYEECPHFL